MSECFVYIMRSGNKTGPLKIGVVKDPESRIQALQTGNPFPITLMIKIPMPSRDDAYHLEGWLHRRFWKARLEGEWFDSRRVIIKTALDDYPGLADRSSMQKVKADFVCGSKQRSEIEQLTDENKRLKREIARLESDIDQMLDRRIDMSHI